MRRRSKSLVDIIKEAKQHEPIRQTRRYKEITERLERQITDERNLLMSDLLSIAYRLELIGEQRAGLLKARMAQRYHTTVARIRAIVTDLEKGEGWS